MPAQFHFNPNRVAYFERAGWEAYYDRKWLRVLSLMVQLNREEFRMSWPAALSAAFDTVRAAIAFAPRENDIPKAQRYLAQFYTKARRASGIMTGAQSLAEAEMDYWVVHRRLAIRRSENPADDDLQPLVRSLANLHTLLFAGAPAAMQASAEWRARAAEAVDRITSHRSTDVAADWREVERCLQQAYRVIRS
jgi:hypothetical protein